MMLYYLLELEPKIYYKEQITSM